MTVPELEAYFTKIEFPATLQLNRGVKYTDLKGFVANHLHVLNKHGLTIATQPFYNRLIDIKKYFDKQ